ncbi:TRAP transporter large permease [Maritalea myrionectae]|uniref:TRAP transporter large permease protein n=1 Tax=Maritalea myrionectae TaxID=454601 RepID=A0A2R4MB94_9HYPH|nr:TRAP transporter large permease subunit [Maritalea myrionectae]AVX03215.1 putative TRAP transporter large permease protein [Maritalea myrionectae]
MTPELLAFIMFGVTIVILILGFPVALSLAGSAILFAFIGDQLDLFRFAFLNLSPTRIFSTMKNEPLVAVPLFVYMGVVLQRSDIAGQLLESMGQLFGKMRGGLGYSVVIVGALLAASTGIVGATVVTMGLMSLPVMLKAGYNPKVASGIICASGTLGQIIPPSIVLVLLASILQGVNEEAAAMTGNLAPDPVTAIDLFAGALVPGLLLVGLYLGWVFILTLIRPNDVPSMKDESIHAPTLGTLLRAVLPPLILIVLVLGSILAGIATPTESAAVGAIGAMLLALQAKKLNLKLFRDVGLETVKVSSMVFLIIIGAGLFSTVFKGFGGDDVIAEFLRHLPGGAFSALLLVMLLMFFLGFFLDFIEIIYVVVPIVGPILIALGYDPLWLGVMIAINLQTSFLTPPFGFALFYLRGVAPKGFKTSDLYAGVLPFIAIQVLALALLWTFPSLVTWLPNLLFS